MLTLKSLSDILFWHMWKSAKTYNITYKWCKKSFLNKKNCLKIIYCKKSKKIVKKLLTLQFKHVILYRQPREVGANDLWKLSKIMSFVDRIKMKSIL